MHTKDLIELDNFVGPPYFDKCPHGETIVLRLPETSNRIWLPITWRAHDAHGKELLLKSNLNMSDNKIVISWVANGDVGQQTVVLEAKDFWGQTATCQFQIKLEGNLFLYAFIIFCF